MKKLFYIVIILNFAPFVLCNRASSDKYLNRDLNLQAFKDMLYAVKVITIGTAKVVTPFSTPVTLTYQGYQTHDKFELKEAGERLTITSLKSFGAAVLSGRSEERLFKLFFRAHALALVPALCGLCFVRSKQKLI